MAEWEKERLNPSNWLPDLPASRQVNLVRRIYHQEELNKDADYQKKKNTLGRTVAQAARGCGVGGCLRNSMPILSWLPRYKLRRDLVGDIIAGCTTAIMHIPQGMAYALLSEVPPIVGLYMAFFPVLIYVIFGTSPHVSMGTFAVACLMAGKVVNAHATHPEYANISNLTADVHSVAVLPHTGPEYSPIQVLSVVCLMVGIFQVCMWVLRLGALSTLLSEPLVSGFTTAASFHVLASQLKDLFGIRVAKFSGNFKIIFTVIEVCRHIPEVKWAALVVSAVTCVVIAFNNELLKPWVSKRSRIPVPIELLAVVAGTGVSKIWDLHRLYGISLVGEIPTGLPVPELPPVALLPVVAVDAFTITMVTYTISMSMALIFASKEKYEIDANQELLALGASNVFGSFFGCAPLCASLSRSYIQYQAGGKTPLTSVVSAMLVLCVLLWVGPFFEDLPRAVLAGIIVVSLKGMFMQVTELNKFWKLSKLDAVVWLVTFLVVVLVNIDIGLVAGLVASVGALFFRAQKPYTCLLGRVRDTDIYLDIKRYRAAEEIPGVKIFHYCGGLNFASKNTFRATLFRKVGALRSPDSVAASEPELLADEDNNLKSGSYQWDPTISARVRCVVIDLTALSYVDAPGVKMLRAVHADLLASNVHVLLAGANGPVLEMIERYNKLQAETERLEADTFPTVHDAIVYYSGRERKLAGRDVALTLPESS